MSQDCAFRVDQDAAGMTVAVVGRVDDKLAAELGSILDDGLAHASPMTVRIEHKDLSLLGWAVIERAARIAAGRGLQFRIEPDSGLAAAELRMARAWLDALEHLGGRTEPGDKP